MLEQAFRRDVPDLNQHGLPRFEVLDRFKADDVGAEVIVLTGETSVDTAFYAMKLGVNDYLCKRFPLPEPEEPGRMALEYVTPSAGCGMSSLC